MINLLFDPLPKCVQVDGAHYPVVTDFRDWIAFADLILDPDISQQNKAAAAMQWYPDARPPDTTKALHALKWFLALYFSLARFLDSDIGNAFTSLDPFYHIYIHLYMYILYKNTFAFLCYIPYCNVLVHVL